ncbi:MAG: HNH endonuclease, partial [bacterium]
ELLFRDGFKCMKCKITPSYFALGKDNAGRWHLDLYGKDLEQDDHMFTIDHIYPKSRGGENKIENYQLLCKKCNEKKGNKIEGEDYSNNINPKRQYIDKKLMSLTQQIKGIINKLKNKVIICIKEQDGFTVGKEYKILDLKIRINKKNNIKYEFVSLNDNGVKVFSNFDNFITKIDYIKIKNK